MRYGYFRIYILLRREGWLVNHKRVYRLYREDGLSLRLRRPRRNVSAANRERQADRQRLRGIVQRPAAGRMPERPLVPVAGGRPCQDRGVAAGLQREPSSHIAWLAYAVEYAAAVTRIAIA